MQDTSVYCVECVCGREIESSELITTCPHCRRTLIIEWRESEPTSSSGRPVSLKVEAE